MAKGQHFTPYQQGIVKRYYEHADSRLATSLQELLSNLAVAEPGKPADKLWKKAGELLTKAKVAPARAESIITARDLKALAELITQLTKV